MPRYELQNISDLEQKFIKLVEITRKLRYWEKKWKKDYGHANREAMKLWQQRADEFLDNLPIKETGSPLTTDNSQP